MFSKGSAVLLAGPFIVFLGSPPACLFQAPSPVVVWVAVRTYRPTAWQKQWGETLPSKHDAL